MGGGILKGEEGLIEIKRGDTLSKIALEQGVTVDKLLELNPQITNKDKIYAGLTLTVPDVSKSSTKLTKSTNTTTYTVKKGDTLSGIAQKNGVSLNLIIVDNPKYKDDPNIIKVGDVIKIKSEESEEQESNNIVNTNNVTESDSIVNTNNVTESDSIVNTNNVTESDSIVNTNNVTESDSSSTTNNKLCIYYCHGKLLDLKNYIYKIKNDIDLLSDVVFVYETRPNYFFHVNAPKKEYTYSLNNLEDDKTKKLVAVFGRKNNVKEQMDIQNVK